MAPSIQTGQTANRYGRHPNGARRHSRRRNLAGVARGAGAGRRRRRDRVAGVVRGHANGLNPALRIEAERSADDHGGYAAVIRSRRIGGLSARAQGVARRSDGCVTRGVSAIRSSGMTLLVRDKEQRLMMSLRANAGTKYSKSMRESGRVSSTTLCAGDGFQS
jgi:hypothetical protein